MATSTTRTNKPIIPRGQDASPLKYNRAALYSGKALDFDGVNDSVTTGNISIQSSNTWAIVSNIYIDSTTSAGYFFDAREGSFDGYGVYFSNTGLLNYFDANGDHYSSHNFPINQYFNIAIIRNGSDVSFYENGVFVESIESVATYSVTGDFYIGTRFSNDDYLKMKMGGFKAFNVALTAAQVADLYNNPEKIVPTGVSNDALKLWLPMMEGAGTTCYDGSGGGNHGTISGATWTHGIGSPVAQTAVIDWNKGRNMTHYSEDGTQWTTGGNAPTITQDQADPFGGTRAQRITMDASGTFAQVYKGHNQILSGVQYTAKMWLKAVSGTPTIGINYNGSGGTWHQVTLTNEWAEYEVTRTMNADYSSSHNILIGSPAPGTSSTADFYVYGLQIKLGDTAGPYIPTFGTAQTSDVLLPQGLTSGRDITGVNLFENVRKQGALNLDGNSWAEVHDNASLDMTTTATMEAWVYADALDLVYDIIMVKSSGTTWSGDYGRYLLRARSNNIQWHFDTFTNGKNYAHALSGWNHLAVTKDGTEEKLYLNGALVSTQTGVATFNASAYSLVIGANTIHTENWISPIAQPRIYNRALTAEEVQRNYDAGKNTYKN